MTNKSENKPEEPIVIEKNISKKCGIVMPISSMDGYPESHWKDIRNILTSAINNADFEARIVSESDDIGVIHQRIVQNLYDNPMIVCDISGRNPNVMFELGLRLAFDKPTIIVKDDVTQYSFDTSVIEHLTYPKDLRHQKIENFKAELTDRIYKTYQKFIDNPSEYSTFLKHFGSFKVPEIESNTVPVDQYIIEELKNIRNNLDRLNAKSTSKKDVENIYDSKIHKIFSFSQTSTDIVDQVYTPVYQLDTFDDIKSRIQGIKQVKHLEIKASPEEANIVAYLDKPMQAEEALGLFNRHGIDGSIKHVISKTLYLDRLPF